IIVLGASDWWWVEHDRALRQAEIARLTLERARQVGEELAKARALREQAKAAPDGDLRPWTDALAAAKRAKGPVAGGEVDEDVRRQVEELLAELQEEERDRRMVERLEAIRLELAYSNLGHVLKEKGNVDEAITANREALRLKPDFAPGHY